MEDFKIKNLTPEQSRVIQETVFKSGGSWTNGDKEVQHINCKMLCLFRKRLSLTYDLNYFTIQRLPEITFEEFERKYITKLPPHISELPYVEMEVRDTVASKWRVRKVICKVRNGCYVISEGQEGIVYYSQYRPIKPKTTLTKQQIAKKFGVEVENLIITE